MENGKNYLMLVEDNEAHAELAVCALEETGNTIIVMKDGREAINYLRYQGEWAEKLNRPIPDIILLDLKMPNMNGMQVLKEVKGDAKFKSIPVVMLTSSGLESDMKECYELGANSYIVKPVTYSEFVKTVKEIPEYWLKTNRLPEG